MGSFNFLGGSKECMSESVKQESINIIQDIYEDLGFRLVGTKQEDSRTSAFYQKTIGSKKA